MSLKRLGNFDRVVEVLVPIPCGSKQMWYIAENCEVTVSSGKYRIEAGVKITTNLARAYLMPGGLAVRLAGDFETWEHKGAVYLDSGAWCVLRKIVSD